MRKKVLLFVMMLVLGVFFIPRVLMAGDASPVIDANNTVTLYSNIDFGIFNNKLYFSTCIFLQTTVSMLMMV
jgi:hypothetical protein